MNCPQLQGDSLSVSELFGHARGSFTGATADRKGAFEQAGGGILFLDEIADLAPGVQTMLLRTLSTSEFSPVGSERPRQANVQIISATNRPLNALVASGAFRFDLFFRLRQFHLTVPPLRARGNDWQLIAEWLLVRLGQKYEVIKRLAPASVGLLARHAWPGNVRELENVIKTGYMMADGDTIEPIHLEPALRAPVHPIDEVSRIYERLTAGTDDFWTSVYQPFMDRLLNRAQVKIIVCRGFAAAGHNYRQLVDLFHLPAGDYDRFMSFLRHHNLKPSSVNGETDANDWRCSANAHSHAVATHANAQQSHTD